MPTGDFLAFDIGNSRVKVGLFHEGELFAAAAADRACPSLLDRLLERLRAKAPRARAILATVDNAMAERLLGELAERRIRSEFVLRSDGRLFETGLLACDVETPATTGVDRLLSGIAAVERSDGASAIVVDCGTAITVNLTTADRVFRGGAIFPGLGLLAAALHRGSAALPRVALSEPPAALGRSTADAIRSGLFYASAGGIERLIAEMARTPVGRGSQIAVYLTGGDAALLSPYLQSPHVLAPHLVLEGLAIAAERMPGVAS